MKIMRGSESVPNSEHGSVLTIGNFDGVHRGHQALLGSVIRIARELGRRACVYTFDPHPRRLLMPERGERLLMTPAQLEEALEARGIDLLIREPFTLGFAKQSAEEFLSQVIQRRLQPYQIFVGGGFHFGKGRAGSAETLQGLAPRLGIRVDLIPQVETAGSDISSTRIRQAVSEGDVAEATRCLGRPYSIWGQVVHGDHRGRTLGFPTANLETENELLPALGVYASTVRLIEQGRPAGKALPAVTNVGTRPTFEPGRVLTEVHLLGFEGDLYGRELAVDFHEHIRAERKFSGPEALRKQIAVDSARALELLTPRAD